MKYIHLICFLVLVLFSRCTTEGGPGFLQKKSPHEQYAKKLKDAGLDKVEMGRAWLNMAKQALFASDSIALPYKEMGYFSSDQPRAVGLNFSAKKGEKLLVQLEKKPSQSFVLFVDLWQVKEDGEHSRLLSFDQAQANVDYDVDETGVYLIRLQPELLSRGEYTLSISVGPSLNFPVAGKLGKIGSVWGDERDAGARRHEGIDLFAHKRAPVVAAADGVITKVNENRLGGKVVWQRPKGKNMSFYYAHLDEQLVKDGQPVKAGDTIGLVGNTGNARTTPPHLHFGIYTNGGAIDPLPFVNPVIKNPAPIPQYRFSFHEELRLSATITIGRGNNKLLKNNTLVKPVAINSKNARAMLPDSSRIIVPLSKLEQLAPIESIRIKKQGYVYDNPSTSASRKFKLREEDRISIMGFFADYVYIKTEAGSFGWMSASIL